MFLSSKYW